jgi:O-acetylhomoserine (thiol)-lyase
MSDTDRSAGWSFETKQIHAGQSADTATGARALPIYQTTSYVFRDTDHAAALFGLAEPGNIYTRIMNPTQDVVEQRVAALEGGVAALLLSSGQAAETIAILNLAEAGDHIVSSPSLYGGTYNLFHYTLPKLGIEVSFVEDPNDPQSWQAAVRPNTKAFFGETIANPKSEILDIEAVADVAHRNGVPLIVDNTVPTPYLVQPLKWGADIVVHSATKYLGGHGTAIAGVIVDGGTFDWKANAERFPQFNTPDPSYHGLVYADALGPIAYIIKARVTSAPRSRRSTRSSWPRVWRPSACASSVMSRTPSRSRPGSSSVTRSRSCTTPGSSRRRGTSWPASTSRAAPARFWRSRSRAASRPASGSSTRSSCTATWPTSGT